jgi:ATP citrate (pro-S)-lyase
MLVAQIQFDSPESIAPENYPAHVKEVLDRTEVSCAWVKDGRKLVAKPDMLIKRRGKSGLLCLNKGWEESRKWIEERAGKLQKVSCVMFFANDRSNTFKGI